jgi:adenine phosphoribosyltransferase
MRNGYPYVVNPLMDGIPRMDPDILREVTGRMMELSDFDCDVILAPEAMAIPFATAISLAKNKPYAVIRKRSYGCDGEIPIDKSTGYSQNRMYINGIKEGEKIVIVDDVISTGGTMSSIVKAIENHGCIITDIVVAIDKSDDINKISEKLG